MRSSRGQEPVQPAQRERRETDQKPRRAGKNPGRDELSHEGAREGGQRGDRPHAGAGRLDRESGSLEQTPVTGQREVLVVVGMAVVALEKRCGGEDEAASDGSDK